MVLPPKPASNKGAAHEIAPQASNRAEIDGFLTRMRTARSQRGGSNGRLIFAMDATMRRQPTWDAALQVQAEMFNAVKAVGGLDVQLVFFRGFDECRASRWVSDAGALARLMTSVECRGGYTQIAETCAARGRLGQSQRAGLRWRRDGREPRRACEFGWAAWSSLHSSLPLSGRP